MTIELALCLIFIVIAAPVSKSIAAHYAIFAIANISLLGHAEADESILVLTFILLAVADAGLFMSGGRAILLLSAAASAALGIESMLSVSWLLDRITYLSAAVNAAIAIYLAREYWIWTHGK